MRVFEVQNSILDIEIDQCSSADENDDAKQLLSVHYYNSSSRIWNPLECCGPVATTTAEQLDLFSSHDDETMPPMIASEISSDFDDAADRLLRSRTGHQQGTSYTRISHIRQLETWDCGRYRCADMEHFCFFFP